MSSPENIEFVRMLRNSGWTQREAAQKLGLTQGMISQYVNGIAKPGGSVLVAMRMLLHKGREPGEESETLGDMGMLMESPKKMAGGGPYWGTTTLAPIVSWASAGEARAFEDMGDSRRVPVTCKDPNCYVLELEGHSMEPIYQPGDLIVCAPNMQPTPGDLVMAKTSDDDVYFKRYRVGKRGEIRLESYNPNYPVMEFKKGEIRKIHVVQSVIRVLKGRP